MAEVPQSPHFNLLTATSQPNGKSRELRLYLKHSLQRENGRGNEFKQASQVEKNAKWFNKRWRVVIIEWFQKVGAVYRMDDITIDNAIFFLDSYLYSQMNSGSSMLREDFQMIAMVSLLISSKMFGIVGCQVSIMELIRLAPQLRIKPHDVCVMELTLIQTLKFNLFVATSREIVGSLIGLFIEDLGGPDSSGARSFTSPPIEAALATTTSENSAIKEITSWAVDYLKILERDFANMSYLQSVKAVAASSCAIARWDVKHRDINSSTDEATAISEWLLSASESIQQSGFLASAWREIIASIPGLSPMTDPSVIEVQAIILKSIVGGRTVFYPISPSSKDSICRRESGRSTGAASIPHHAVGGPACENSVADCEEAVQKAPNAGNCVRAHPRPRRPSLGSSPQSSPIRGSLAPQIMASTECETDVRNPSTAADATSTSTTAFSAVKSRTSTEMTSASSSVAMQESKVTSLPRFANDPKQKLLALIKPTALVSDAPTSNTASCSPVDVMDIDCCFPAQKEPETAKNSKKKIEVDNIANAPPTKQTHESVHITKRRKVTSLRRSSRLRGTT